MKGEPRGLRPARSCRISEAGLEPGDFTRVGSCRSNLRLRRVDKQYIGQLADVHTIRTCLLWKR